MPSLVTIMLFYKNILLFFLFWGGWEEVKFLLWKLECSNICLGLGGIQKNIIILNVAQLTFGSLGLKWLYIAWIFLHNLMSKLLWRTPHSKGCCINIHKNCLIYVCEGARKWSFCEGCQCMQRRTLLGGVLKVIDAYAGKMWQTPAPEDKL